MTRWQWKLRLIKGLYDRGLKREQVRQLFRVLDWIMALPPELDESFRSEFARFEEERQMPYVTSIERLAREEGRQEGRQEGLQEGLEKGIRKGLRTGVRKGVAEGFQNAILRLLEVKFKKVAAKHEREIRSVREVKQLEALLRAANVANNLDEALAPLREKS